METSDILLTWYPSVEYLYMYFNSTNSLSKTQKAEREWKEPENDKIVNHSTMKFALLSHVLQSLCPPGTCHECEVTDELLNKVT